MNAVDLDQLDYCEISDDDYQKLMNNISVHTAVADNRSILIHDWDGRIKSLSEILNEIRYRIAILEEKEKAREQECVCETIL